MGSKSSKSKRHEDTTKYGEIYLKTHRQACFAGETISGEVYLNLISPYPGNKLILRIKGKEVVHIVNTEAMFTGAPNTPVIPVLRHRREDRKLLDKAVTIHEWSSIIPGQYVIPFTCQLPQDLPSSFHQSGRNYLANVSYRLEAFLEPINIKVDPKLKFKQNIAIKKPLTKEDQELSKQITTPIRSLKFINKGSNVLSAELEKSWYYPGEIVRAKIQLDNSQCKSTNTEITFSFKQKLRLKIPRAKLKKNFVIASNTLSGVHKGSSSGVQTVQIQLPPIQGDIDYKDAKRDNMQRYLCKQTDDNSLMHSTTETSMISSKYFLKVSCSMKGVHASAPKLIFPIEICTPGVEFQPVSAPKNWNPVQMKSSALKFGS